MELNLDEIDDLMVTESKASYKEIKAYVLEHSGLKVSNLYIVQVKRANEKHLLSKCESVERENYNLPKFEDARQANCPEKTG